MTTLQTIVKPAVTHTQLVRYAGASGDFNPIHTVVPAAEQAGLGGVIAHGMLIMGMAGEALTQWFSHKQLRSFKVRFSGMTRPGEALIIEGNCLEQTVCNGEPRTKGEMVVRNEAGEVKLRGYFEVAGA
jgi:acyl dehydratase